MCGDIPSRGERYAAAAAAAAAAFVTSASGAYTRPLY
jgi:hypothetical protein